MMPHLTIADLDILKQVYQGWDTGSLEIVVNGGPLDSSDGIRILIAEAELEERERKA